MDLFKPRRLRLSTKGKERADTGTGGQRTAERKSAKGKKKAKKATQEENGQAHASTGCYWRQSRRKRRRAHETAYPKTVWISR